MADSAPPAAAQRLQVLRVLWVAQLASVVLFVVVGAVLAGRGAPVEATVTDTLRPLLWLLAFGLAAVSIWLRRSFSTPAVGPTSAPPQQLWSRLHTRCVIVWTMSEAVGVLGLVLGILTRDLGQLMPFAGAALALLYVHRPAAWPIDTLPREGGS